jgi:hypothetical protein
MASLVAIGLSNGFLPALIALWLFYDDNLISFTNARKKLGFIS